MGNGLPLRLVCRKLSDTPETWQATLQMDGYKPATFYAGNRDDALRQAMRHMLAVADLVTDEPADVAA